MKRWIYILLFLFLSGVFLQYSFTDKRDRDQLDRINHRLDTLFRPMIENTSFLIEETEYILTMYDVKLNTDRRGYLSSPPSYEEAIISFSVYKNEIQQENFIGSKWFSGYVYREETDSEIYLYPIKPNEGDSAMMGLYSRFTDVLFDYLYHENMPRDWEEKSATYRANEENIEYDDRGELVNTGLVTYYVEQEAHQKKMIFESEFVMKQWGEPLRIEINVKASEEGWLD